MHDAREVGSPGPSRFMRVEGLGKAYGPNTVLADVTLDIVPGEIHAIIGENGAGKSTFMRLLSGHVRPTAGTISLDGRPIAFSGPPAAEAAGIVLVHQEILLAEGLTVAENLFLGRELTRRGMVDDRAMRRIASEKLAAIGCTVSPDMAIRKLAIADRQLVQIARALLDDHRLVIFDEPTAVLTNEEVGRLLDVIRGLRARGVAVLYISHRLDEVEQIADKITVLRDGRMIGSYVGHTLTQADMARLMVGRELSMLYPPKRGVCGGAPLLEVEHAHVPGFIEDVSFTLRAGEVLGFGGMIGAGRSELFEALLGLRPGKAGAVRVSGKPVRIRSPLDGIEAGIGYLTEDRKGKGLLLKERLAPNLTLSALSRFHRRPFLETRREDAALGAAIERYDIRLRSRHLVAGQLSGGNQQKLLLAKVLMTDPAIVIIDEPTRGIDIGNKRQIYTFIQDLLQAGKGCIVISSDLQELIGLCDRILVIRAGRIAAELSGEAMTEHNVILAATGSREPLASPQETPR
ncbi:sugar ABC transporter ATP-binding protein [Labrys monachus]|nr:sugar ABC transporter ATP-binding protein [Labrys monachus]